MIFLFTLIISKHSLKSKQTNKGEKMKISTKGRYAVRAMYEIAVSQKDFISITDISQSQGISIKYLEQIISLLSKNKLVTSQKGAQGGYKLTKAPNQISIYEILHATNDTPHFAPCLENKTACPRATSCPTINCWDSLTTLIVNFLKSITLQDLINKTTLQQNTI